MFLQTVHLPCPGLFLIHRRSSSCILGWQPYPTLIRPRAICRRSVSCIYGVFANFAFTVPWAIFDAQGQYFVHSGLRTLSNNYPTTGNFLCTGVASSCGDAFVLTSIHIDNFRTRLVLRRKNENARPKTLPIRAEFVNKIHKTLLCCLLVWLRMILRQVYCLCYGRAGGNGRDSVYRSIL